jgi:xanthine dehydrogenase YagS FAD-binding subunit
MMAWHIAIDEPRPFELHAPATLREALELALGFEGDSAFLAGGCDLVDQLKHQWRSPRHVINLKTIPGLAGIRRGSDSFHLGALTTLWEIERHAELRELMPALVQSAFRVATPQIRAVGTVGGNLLQDSRCPYYRGPWHCYRDGGIVCDAHHGINIEHALFGGSRCYTVSPSDTAPALVALDAEVIVSSLHGEARLPLSELFVLPKEDILHMHRLRRHEILTGIEISVRQGQRSMFVKFAPRGSWDFAQASVAVAFTPHGGRFADCRVVLGGVAPTPWRSTPAEAALEGHAMRADTIEAAVDASVRDAEPLAYNAYKVGLVRKGLRQVLTELTR